MRTADLTRHTLRTTFAAMLAISGSTARAQPPGAPTSATTIHGRVVADDSGQPLRNARVAVQSDVDATAVLTDAEGGFAIAAPAGRRELIVSKTGYASGTTATSDGVEVRLARGGAIIGRVVDDRGLPAPMLLVAAEALVRSGGRSVPRPAASVETDDHGEYRLYGLAAGDYAVSVGGVRLMTPGGLAGRTAVPTYYPGVPVLTQAQPIHVAAGDEVAGIDLTLKYVADRPRNASGLIIENPNPATVVPPASDPDPSGTIHGRVTGPEGLPLAHAHVSLESLARLFTPDSAQTDDEGWYAFRDVRPGDYVISAIMPGYRPMTAGQRTPWERGDLVTMRPDRAEVRVDLAMSRGSAIAGRVVDEYGDPVENVAVSVAAIRVVAGRPHLVGAPRAVIRPAARTDDRGRYRIFGLAAGQFVVVAAVGQRDLPLPQIDLPGYTRTFYPATLAATEAALVEVRDGEDRLNVDIALVKGGVARLAGRVIGVDGKPASATVSLAPSNRSGSVVGGVRSVKADGTFDFADVPPGEYVVQAERNRVNPSTEGAFAARFVTVNGTDVPDLTLSMSSGSQISGRIVFEDADAPASAEAFELSPVAGDPDYASLASNPVARADIHDDWTFEMGGVTGSRRLRVVHAPDGWMLKSILAGGLDATDRPLPFGTADQSLTDVVVMMTKRATEIAGSVTDEKGGPRADSAVVVFACDRDLRYAGSRFVASAGATADATFALRGVAPADYYVAAVDKRGFADVAQEIDNPEFLESLVASATRVTLEEGQRATLTLRVSR
ncbi:MAG TPA: carboxypeptidase-like regulatory domain-containing protein [Vicinamibacterales bacterium]|nr:carboxypeptidase-like regulatory domain-containing protein [Vicinamibacterales bacterium]